MVEIFSRSESWLSKVLKTVSKIIIQRVRDILFFDEHRLTPQIIDHYRSLVEMTSGRKNIWDFIDGTLLRICKP